MKNKTDKFLLCALWLLAVTLGACFWFNSMYGFNLFNGAHWKYLATLQAAQTPIQSGFYISMVVFTVVSLIGLYILVRPRFRRIQIPRIPNKQKSHTTAPVAPTPSSTPMPAGLARPMRPNVSRTTSFDAMATATPTPTTPIPAKNYDTEIRDIFSGNGYVVKNAPTRIERTPIALLAIGTNEQLWIGGYNIAPDDLTRAIDKLNQVFYDTLDDIFINVHGFIVSPTDGVPPDANLLTFKTTSELSEYISAHPNPTPSDDERENFNAYSEYVDTVMTYIGQV